MLFKPGDAPSVYQAMAASDTKNIDSNTGYDFKERIPVKQGYVLGVVQNSVGNIGLFPVSGGDLMGGFPADVQVGDTATATDIRSARLAVAATVESDKDGDGFGDVSQDQCPTQGATHDACSNTFSFGKLKRKRSRGTATLAVTVPGPGTLSLTGTGIVKQLRGRAARAAANRAVAAAGTAKLFIKAKGQKKRKLNRVGKVRVKLRVTYQPTDGAKRTQSRRVKLIKR
jgi:hypothetical protein